MARSKFNVDKNTAKRTCNGIVFDSELEMKYYRDVVLPGVESGRIKYYELQKPYELQPKFVHGEKTVQPISVNASDIGDVLRNSISSLSITGNTLDQAIAMGATISEITGDASEAGNTLKVLSMRLRGAKTEIENAGESTDGMAESTSEFRDQIKALTNVTGNDGFDIMLDENTFKSTYDINGINQSALIELIAGKQRGNTVSALLTNMAQADDILQDSLNSAGSAVKEYESYLNSTEGKIQGFKTAFEDLSDTTINSDFLKTAIDFGTKLIDILDELIEKTGAFPAIIRAIAGVMEQERG